MQAACTIIAKNYIAFARTLAESYVALHPGHKMYVLVVDEFDGFITREDECFEIVTLADLNIPNVRELCFKYDLKELCTAVKARMLEYLLNEKTVNQLLYLDPDTLVSHNLDRLFEKLNTYNIVLTPHLDKDFPNDGLLPNDSHILRAGQFNLGFIGVNSGENAKAFLKWWKAKLDEHCVVDPMNGYFVDQRFIDFVPLLFENYWIERDAGYNVAYWNLHSRTLSQTNGAWRCNTGPLYFFHFSGYLPEESNISSHIPLSMARHTLSNRADLREFFEQYKTSLFKNGYSETSKWPYSFAAFTSGKVIPNHVRRYFREMTDRRNGHVDPFSSEKLMNLAESIQDETTRDDAAVAQLNSILNSRAWSWVSRYGRLKARLSKTLRSKA
jgi:hypothetical protein